MIRYWKTLSVPKDWRECDGHSHFCGHLSQNAVMSVGLA